MAINVLVLSCGFLVSTISCSLAVDTTDLNAGNDGLDCESSQKVCPLFLEAPEGPGECVDLDTPQRGCSSSSCRPCEVPGAEETRCTREGNCGYTTCKADFQDCDSDESNGCETDISFDEENCGACGIQCDIENAVADCILGKCEFVYCGAPFEDCNGSLDDGCETNLHVDAKHCGACGAMCADTCAEGICIP